MIQVLELCVRKSPPSCVVHMKMMPTSSILNSVWLLRKTDHNEKHMRRCVKRGQWRSAVVSQRKNLKHETGQSLWTDWVGCLTSRTTSHANQRSMPMRGMSAGPIVSMSPIHIGVCERTAKTQEKACLQFPDCKGLCFLWGPGSGHWRRVS